MVYDYYGKKRLEKQTRRVRTHSKGHRQLDVVTNLGLKFRNSEKPITQRQQTRKMISQDPTCKDEGLVKSSVERKVDGFLEDEVDRCLDAQWNPELLKTRRESF